MSALPTFTQADLDALDSLRARIAQLVPPPPPPVQVLPGLVAAARAKAQANTPQYQAFLARLDANLLTLPHSYEASWATWEADYALGWLLSGKQTYADKALGGVKALLYDYQDSAWSTRVPVARGDGSTTAFPLPNTPLAGTLTVWTAPVWVRSTVRGSGATDLIDWTVGISKVSNTQDGNPDYQQGVDWNHARGVLPEDAIQWLPGGKAPAAGATYYVTEASCVAGVTPLALGRDYTLGGQTLTLTTAPTVQQAVLVEYLYADPVWGAYTPTGRGDGGFNSILVDDGYMRTDSASLRFDRQRIASVSSSRTDSASLRLVAVGIAVRGAWMLVRHPPSPACVSEPVP